MKLATVTHDGVTKAGSVEGDNLAVRATGELAESWVEAIVQSGTDGSEAPVLEEVPLAAVRYLSPIPSPRNALICVGKNYFDHAEEFRGSGFDGSAGAAIPEEPIIFSKASSSVVGHGAAIRAGIDPTGSVDYEGELGVVIGRDAFAVSPERAYDVVFGYTIINDVTSRELQRKHQQWFIGKSLDTFGPMGPWIVTADEVEDVAAMRLETHVNGELRQSVLVRDLIFDIPRIISTLTATQTLRAGDIIATGTPAGVGIGSTPPRYLEPGDVVSVRITGLGTLENPVSN